MIDIDQKTLKILVNYNPHTGIFTRLNYKRLSKYGDRADTPHNKGYRQVSIENRAFLAHRLAWLYMTGKWPKNLIDHKDGVKDNNKWENLREATNSQNRHNSKVHRNNISGIKGVYKIKGKYRVIIGLGTFDTLEEASNVYKKAAIKLHGEFYKT